VIFSSNSAGMVLKAKTTSSLSLVLGPIFGRQVCIGA
jgi:hypothetical protein